MLRSQRSGLSYEISRLHRPCHPGIRSGLYEPCLLLPLLTATQLVLMQVPRIQRTTIQMVNSSYLTCKVPLIEWLIFSSTRPKPWGTIYSFFKRAAIFSSCFVSYGHSAKPERRATRYVSRSCGVPLLFSRGSFLIFKPHLEYCWKIRTLIRTPTVSLITATRVATDKIEEYYRNNPRHKLCYYHHLGGKCNVAKCQVSPFESHQPTTFVSSQLLRAMNCIR